MSPLPSVARELAGSIVVFVEPSKNLVQTSLPFASSLRRPTGSGALGSEKSAMVVPDGSVAIATTPAASLPLPTVETQPANCQPGSGTGVRTICVPSARIAEQVVPQSIPAGAERTVPEPLFDTVRKCCATGPGSGGGTLWDPDVPDFPPHATTRTATPTTAPPTTLPFRLGFCSLPIPSRSR